MAVKEKGEREKEGGTRRNEGGASSESALRLMRMTVGGADIMTDLDMAESEDEKAWGAGDRRRAWVGAAFAIDKP